MQVKSSLSFILSLLISTFSYGQISQKGMPISLAESVIEASENDVPDALKGTRQESIQSNHTLAETHRQCPEIVGDLKSFLSQPLSEELMMQCTVRRVKTDFGCLFPKTPQLYTEWSRKVTNCCCRWGRVSSFFLRIGVA